MDATITVTCLTDGRAHAVPDVELATAASHGGGHYRAVCGHLVTAASMVEPDGKPCEPCAEVWSPGREHQSRGFSQRLMRR